MCDRLIFTCGHCGASHDLEEMKRGLYVGERSLGDLQAYERGGPLGLGRRIVRRRVTRAFMRGLWRNLWTPLQAAGLQAEAWSPERVELAMAF
jgi:hypothetical protein